ncbi:hypothetical protein [Streptomyces sp. NPDC001770]
MGALIGVLRDAERDGLAPRFAQTSVDLLRGPDSGPVALSAWTGFEARPTEYFAVLADVVAGRLPRTGVRSGERAMDGGTRG